MKNIIVVIVSLCTLLCACNTKKVVNNEFTISGKLNGFNATSGGFMVPDTSADRGYRREQINFTNGEFIYKGKVAEPTVYTAWLDTKQVRKMVGRGYIPVKCALLFFIAYPGADINVSGEVTDFVNAYAQDGGENDKLAELNKKVFPLMNESGNLMVKKATDKSLSEEQIAAMDKRLEELFNKEMEIKHAFLKNNISSIAGLWLAEDMIIRTQVDMDDIEKYLKKVDKKYHNSQYYKALQTRVEGYRKTKAGNTVDFATTQTLDGKKFDIKSLRGKYVIFDFWGTWCGACCAGMPHLMEFRNKHIDKLEVIAVNCGDTKDRWINSKYTKDYNWIHIKSDKKDNNFANMFNVQGYPTKICIDKEGKILFRAVGESKEFYEKIEKELMH